MVRPTVFRLLALAMLGLALAACGGESEGEEDGERGEAFAPICEMPAMTSETGIPADFPVPPNVTFVKSEDAGPSTIVEGYAEGDISDVYDAWHEAFDDTSYEISFDELEDHDAEISFVGTDDDTGQIKLEDECGEGKVYVRVTSRPEG
jgi:hypothetical protein